MGLTVITEQSMKEKPENHTQVDLKGCVLTIGLKNDGLTVVRRFWYPSGQMGPGLAPGRALGQNVIQ